MDTNSPEAWFKSLPPVTRAVLVTLFSSTCLAMMGLFDPSIIALDWFVVTRKYVYPYRFLILCRYQLWRVLTSGLFLGGFSFGFVMQLYFFTNFGSKLESDQRFNQTPGEYVYFLIIISFFASLASLLVAWPHGYAFTGPSVIFAIIYYWSRCEPESRLSIWGFEVKGYQLPFALLFMTLLMGGDVWRDIVGIAAGHLYFFLKDVLPVSHKINLLRTPAFLQKLVAKITHTEARPVPGPGPQPRRFFTGTGVRLGGN
jgi:Derlin-2/3